jgi:hypothetical protein
MRLSILIGTFLLVEQFTHTVGFSLLPSATTSASTKISSPIRTITSLAALSEPKAAPAKIKVSELSGGSDQDDVQSILSTLDKRIKEGPGSLSSTEVAEFKTGSDRILASLSATAIAPAPEAPAPVEIAPSAAVSIAAAAAKTTVVTLTPEEAVDVYFDGEMPTYNELHTAAMQLDAKKVSSCIAAGLAMDESTTEAAFWAVITSIDRSEREDKPLSADVSRMLHHIFDADMNHLLTREKVTTNVTCMQPRNDGIEGKAKAMSYIFDDAAAKDLPLSEGRRCEGGDCCDECSRNVFPTFATERESSFDVFPELGSISFNELQHVASGTILQFVRLIERVRRTIAHEYGLPLSSILPLQAYSRKYVAGTTQQGGGGGEGDFVTLHTDEATHDGYHYSCVIYLSTAGVDFEGGAFVFNDPAKDEAAAKKTEKEGKNMGIEEQIRRSGRTLIPYNPTKGSAVIFSSGWENMHEVEKITSGVRYAVPCFFTTCPVPDAAYTQMHVGKPSTDEDIADDWLHLLLAHRKELPHEAMGRVKELLMKWHMMCTPLSEH